MANNAVNHFKITNFDAEAFVDKSAEKWKPRKNDPDPGRRLNVKTGRLRQSITILHRGTDSITVGSNVPYSGFVNAVRKIIGKSAVLDHKNQSVMNSFVKNIL
jgi:phage gpG-like protein